MRINSATEINPLSRYIIAVMTLMMNGSPSAKPIHSDNERRGPGCHPTPVLAKKQGKKTSIAAGQANQELSQALRTNNTHRHTQLHTHTQSHSHTQEQGLGSPFEKHVLGTHEAMTDTVSAPPYLPPGPGPLSECGLHSGWG